MAIMSGVFYAGKEVWVYRDKPYVEISKIEGKCQWAYFKESA
jgi:hypothetical protein